MDRGKKSLFLLLFIISCTSDSKIKYEGEQNQDGKYHGKGIITFADGRQWEGEFKDGGPYNGDGIYIWPDSSKYEGEIIDGFYQGGGTFTYPNGKE